MRAHQIMTRDVITVGPGTSIVEAAKLMLDNHLSGVPVLDEYGKLTGVVSEGDFLRRSEIGTQRKRPRWLQYFIGPGRAANEFVHASGRKVDEVMTRNPLVVTEDTTLEEIVRLMEKNHVKRLPVMRGEREPSISPSVTRASLPVWTITPGSPITTPMWVTPPMTCSRPMLAASVSSLSTPFCSETAMV